MKEKDILVKPKNSDPKTIKVLVPESFQEMQTLLSDKEIFKLAIPGYIAQAKRRAVSTQRRKWLKVDLSTVTPGTRAELEKLGLIEGE
jgi:hypothetical protein